MKAFIRTEQTSHYSDVPRLDKNGELCDTNCKVSSSRQKTPIFDSGPSLKDSIDRFVTALRRSLDIVSIIVAAKVGSNTVEHLSDMVALLLILNLDDTLGNKIPDSISLLAASALNRLYDNNVLEKGYHHIAARIKVIDGIDIRTQLQILDCASQWTNNSNFALDLRKYLGTYFICGLDCADNEYGGPRGSSLDAIYTSLVNNGYYKSIMEDKPDKLPPVYFELTCYLKIVWFIVCDPEFLRSNTRGAYMLADLCWNLFSRISDDNADIIEKTKAKHELLFIRIWIRFHLDT